MGAVGTITFTWTANPNVTVAGNTEGDLNALQLAFVSSSTNVPGSAGPDFGANVLIFDPTMPMATIQSSLGSVFAGQQNNQFGPSRYAFFFKPGQYSNLDINLGYYTHVLGLGRMPDDVVIDGNVHSEGVFGQ